MVAAVALVLSSLAGGGAVRAADQSSDEAALPPTGSAADAGIEAKVNDLLAQMTLDEKLQQVQLLSDGQVTDADAQATGVGGVFSLIDPARSTSSSISRSSSPGCTSRSCSPTTRSTATGRSSRSRSARPALRPVGRPAPTPPSARARRRRSGIKQIYSPMVDVSHEPRWGRIAEGNGEDPYLGSVFAAARVKAAQGSSYAAPDKVVTSVKHYAAYGQPEGGRDYNTTDMSEQRLHNLYLPPFKAAIDAGSDTVMCSFNAINGVPGMRQP